MTDYRYKYIKYREKYNKLRKATNTKGYNTSITTPEVPEDKEYLALLRETQKWISKISQMNHVGVDAFMEYFDMTYTQDNIDKFIGGSHSSLEEIISSYMDLQIGDYVYLMDNVYNRLLKYENQIKQLKPKISMETRLDVSIRYAKNMLSTTCRQEYMHHVRPIEDLANVYFKMIKLIENKSGGGFANLFKPKTELEKANIALNKAIKTAAKKKDVTIWETAFKEYNKDLLKQTELSDGNTGKDIDHPFRFAYSQKEYNSKMVAKMMTDMLEHFDGPHDVVRHVAKDLESTANWLVRVACTRYDPLIPWNYQKIHSLLDKYKSLVT
jgi:hypothetical protein